MKNLTTNQASLTKKEADIWNSVKAQKGVVFMQGQAGVAKSAICASIANKLGLNYIDLRLSYMDEVDFGAPDICTRTINGKERKVLDMVLPEWFVEANDKPTLICFEELNRASQEVLNAALGVLNERILHGAEFNKDVYMIATGNLGDADKCAVHEFEAAMRNRLIFIRHELTFAEWCDGYATEHVVPEIVSFLESHLYLFCASSSDISDEGQYHTPRSWTFLSEFISANGGDTYEMLDVLERKAASYVGTAAAVTFTNWLRKNDRLTLKKVLDGKIPEKVDRASAQSVIYDLQKLAGDKGILFFSKTPKKFSNFLDFLGKVEAEIVAGMVSFFLCSLDISNEELSSDLLKEMLSRPALNAVIKQISQEVMEAS